MNLNFTQHKNVGVIEVNGRLDAYNAPELKAFFDQVADKTAYFILDMQGCEFIDSTGLGTIVACLKSASQGGGDIRIVRLQDKPRMVFDITRAYKIFHIFDDLDAGLLSFENEFESV
jgi:anti-sigma B factor antagonist